MNFSISDQQVEPSTLYLVACEDTRTSGRLFERFDIPTRKTSFHSHNEHKKVAILVDKLRTGMSIALVSDAGSPGISDPGYLLVRSVIAAGLNVDIHRD